ncbi:MAG TPA: hypothetical protein VFE17_09895 [Candidatus Baltobacteraceae bacterium]|jgi:hypothetical protein|nr:hypothetical protein [Candidatus Baltobacteraceae bacterium]
MASTLAAAAPALAQTVTPPPAPAPMPTGSTSTIQATIPSKTKATPAPPKDPDANRIGLSGVWEIAIQQSSGVQYTHFKLTQTGTALTGQYLDASGKKYPLAGSVDGKNVRVVVTMPDGSALVFEGAQDGATDMLGTLNTVKNVVGFTASYRPKYKWIDNLTPGTGGVGGSGSGYPGGVP